MYYFSREEALERLPKWLRNNLELSDRISEVYFSYLSRLAVLGENLVLRAAKASQYSQSYRPFPVGCAVLALGSHTGIKETHVYTGHNMKVAQEGRVTCGEVIAVGAARQEGCTHVPLIAIVGNPQEDHGSGLHAPTLHPCFRCRAEFSSLEVIDDNTLIITATHEASERLRLDTNRLFDYPTLYENSLFPVGKPFVAAELRDGVRETISLDDLIEDRVAEAMTFKKLLETHSCPMHDN